MRAISLSIGMFVLVAACVSADTSVNAYNELHDDQSSGGDSKAHHDDDPRPYDKTRDAMADVDAALKMAKVSKKNVIVSLGANWCHDSRGLAAKFQRSELASVVETGYELVYVDVGRRDRNLEVGARFGVPELFGTPTVLILSPDGELLNAESVHEWRTAYSKPYDETLAYFKEFAPSAGN